MTAPYWSDGQVTLYLGRCEDVLPGLPANSVDAIVTDPPAGVSFMNREWDADRGGRDRWVAWLTECMTEAVRVLKPGGHALVWALPRTSGWTQWALEDAGLVIRDCISHLFGSGYPKGLDVGKAIDRQRNDRAAIVRVTAWLAAIAEGAGISRAQIDDHMGTSDMGGWWLSRLEHRCAVPTWDQWLRLRHLIGFGDEMDAEVWRLNGRKGQPGEAWAQRETVGQGHRVRRESTVQIVGLSDGVYDITAPATEDAVRWDGWNVALKPGQEVWWLARKPLKRGTVAANVLEYGTGALNIAACRVGAGAPVGGGGNGSANVGGIMGPKTGARPRVEPHDAGRWPTNIVFTHSAACEVIGTRHLPGDTRSGQEPGDRPGGFGDVGAASGSERPNGVLHGAQAVDVWRCAADCPVGELDRQSGFRQSGSRKAGTYGLMGYQGADPAPMPEVTGDTGGASRYFPTFRYQAKAPAHERPRLADGTAHPTVKPVDLVRWLVRLVTPPGGTVLDCFAGTGVTAESCIVEGFRSILIEQDPVAAELIRTRLRKDIQPDMFGAAS